ncbi:MAG: transposase [Polyangiaceae bacterium]|nr:transposase [Polyangiaceae bacterium]
MHRPFFNAIRGDDVLAKVPFVHDPFHVIKRAGEAVSELRRSIFFRAGPYAARCRVWHAVARARPWERVRRRTTAND